MTYGSLADHVEATFGQFTKVITDNGLSAEVNMPPGFCMMAQFLGELGLRRTEESIQSVLEKLRATPEKQLL